MSANQTVLVTGASGFIGSTVLASTSKHRLLGLFRGKAPTDSSVERRTIEKWDEQSLYDVMGGVDAVVHAASVVHRPGAPHSEYVAFNVEGTRALVAACRRRRIKRLIHLSSIKVYGESPIGIIDERTKTAPEGPYAETKLEAERVVLRAAEDGGPAVTVMRLCPVYGVGDKGNVRTMIRAIAKRRFAVPGDGSTRKSLVHVSTVGDAIMAALDAPDEGVFVLADNETPTLATLSDTIARAVGRTKPPRVPAALMVATASLVGRIAPILRLPTSVSAELVRKSLIDTVCSPKLVERTFGVTCHRDLEATIAEEVAWLRKVERLG